MTWLFYPLFVGLCRLVGIVMLVGFGVGLLCIVNFLIVHAPWLLAIFVLWLFGAIIIALDN